MCPLCSIRISKIRLNPVPLLSFHCKFSFLIYCLPCNAIIDAAAAAAARPDSMFWLQPQQFDSLEYPIDCRFTFACAYFGAEE